MTPKEKAEDIYNRMLQWQPDCRIYIGRGIVSINAKKCALIAVDFASEFITGDLDESFDKALYLAEIKEEIEKLS